MHIHVSALPVNELMTVRGPAQEGSEAVRTRVKAARNLQLERNRKTNAQLTNSETEMAVKLNDEHRKLLNKAMNKFNLSARAYHRILRVARTIADLAGEAAVSPDHLGEAISFRSIERY